MKLNVFYIIFFCFMIWLSCTQDVIKNKSSGSTNVANNNSLPGALPPFGNLHDSVVLSNGNSGNSNNSNKSYVQSVFFVNQSGTAALVDDTTFLHWGRYYSKYDTLASGVRNIKWYRVYQTGVFPNLNSSFNLLPNSFYSYIVYTTPFSATNDIMISNANDIPYNGKIKMRFIDLAPFPNANQTLNCKLTNFSNGNSLSFISRSYLDHTIDTTKRDFITMDAGTYNIKVLFRDSTLSEFNRVFDQGNIYSILAGAKGYNTLNGIIYPNAYYEILQHN